MGDVIKVSGQTLSKRVKFLAAEFRICRSLYTWRHSGCLHRHQQVQVNLPCLGILELHMDPERLHNKVPGKAADTRSLQS